MAVAAGIEVAVDLVHWIAPRPTSASTKYGPDRDTVTCVLPT
jgi:hypothetical protein